MMVPGFWNSNFNNVMRADASEKDGFLNLSVELPGFSKEDISVSLENGCLTVSAERRREEEKEEGRFIRRERVYGSMSRRFYVGENARPEDVSAKYENGILGIKVPLGVKEEAKGRIMIEG